MIGGVDISIPTKTGALSLEASVRVVRQLWIDAVYENGVTGERYLRFEDIPFGKLNEVFIYRDPSAADVWEEKGAVPEAFNSMVHLIFGRRHAYACRGRDEPGDGATIRRDSQSVGRRHPL